jgi:hypothetical protein
MLWMRLSPGPMLERLAFSYSPLENSITHHPFQAIDTRVLGLPGITLTLTAFSGIFMVWAGFLGFAGNVYMLYV